MTKDKESFFLKQEDIKQMIKRQVFGASWKKLICTSAKIIGIKS